MPGGDLNTGTINKIQNHTKVIFELIHCRSEAWSKIVFMWCALSADGEAGVLGELNTSAVHLVHKLLQKSTSLC